MSSLTILGARWCESVNGGNCPGCSSVGSENEFVYDPNPYSYNETPNFFNQPPQPQYETYSCELCGNDSHYGFDCPPRVPLVYEQEPCYNQNFSDNYYPQNSPSFSQQYLCCDNCGGPCDIISVHQPMNQNFNSFGFDHIQPPQQFDNHQPQETPEVTPFVENLIESALNSKLLLINLNSQRLNKEEQEVKNISSVEDLIPIPRESEDSSGSDSESVLPSSDDFSPIFEEKSMTFSNPLFEFDDEYISNDVNLLFDEVLENIESKGSYVSNLDEPALLVTPLFDMLIRMSVIDMKTQEAIR
ncbi:hypothetical protein Tco_0661319 [Tanacetum coccineum]